ncbi:Protein LYK5 [Vitis vinifera]|uniref:Protein LYK5 n=1 Tax=Vitis vinifera TaxID=29760 RepID=A0A438K3R3_VITVI|nr:Protein LYK5 [Vitis vinifera]
MSISLEGIRIEMESLTVYKYEELQKAAGYFGEANRIKGSVYRASFKGDDAAIKMMKGDVSEEINILKQINHSKRVQIAYDAADALNYLHNLISPPCIHKNLKISNILLDGNMRGKVTNFGLARRLGNEEGDGGGLQLTRHVVGTQGYMAPEYVENGVVTPKLDIFAFGVVILELLTGKEAAPSQKKEGGELLSVSINEVLQGDNVRDKLRGFIDPCLAHEYPFDLAFSMAQLAKSCVAHDLNARPTMSDIFVILSKILSSSLDWDPSDDFQASGSLSHGCQVWLGTVNHRAISFERIHSVKADAQYKPCLLLLHPHPRVPCLAPHFQYLQQNGRERIEIWGGQPGAIPLVLLLERGIKTKLEARPLQLREGMGRKRPIDGAVSRQGQGGGRALRTLESRLQAQQAYLNNDQLDCDNNSNNTKGFVCNGPRKSCLSYLTFRSAPPSYDSPPSIAYLLNSNPSDIATINQISDVNKIPKDTVLIVPVNCSCSGHFYQYNASYTLKYDFENYFTLANNTYQGLTTCQALKAHNHITIETFPWVWTCWFLSYAFGVDDIQSIFDANGLSSDLIFPFTPILVPLKNPPTRIQTTLSPPPPKSPVVPNGGGADSSKKWVYVGVGIGATLLVLLMPSGIILCLLRRRLQSRQDKPVPGAGGGTKKPSYSMENNISLSVSSGGIHHAVESLTVYKYEELQKAAGFFGEANRIKGCVYRGLIKGDDAAIKMMKGDLSEEINILKLINHSNVIRLSGFCVHKGNTYLVYEYAENGSLSDWLHGDGRIGSTLGWKQRVQIACDVANA